MLKIALAIACALPIIVSCGAKESDKLSKAAVEACIGRGDPEATCGCIVGAMAEHLGKADFEKFADISIRADDAAGEKFMQAQLASNPDMMTKLIPDLQACSGR